MLPLTPTSKLGMVEEQFHSRRAARVGAWNVHLVHVRWRLGRFFPSLTKPVLWTANAMTIGFCGALIRSH